MRKIVMGLFVLALFISCDNSNNVEKKEKGEKKERNIEKEETSWGSDERDAAFDDCVSSKVKKDGLTKSQAKKNCDCLVDKLTAIFTSDEWDDLNTKKEDDFTESEMKKLEKKRTKYQKQIENCEEDSEPADDDEE